MIRNRFDESQDHDRPPVASGLDRSLLCTSPGCGRVWTCDFGRRLCSEHDAARHASHANRPPHQRTRALPTIPSFRQAARSFAEPNEPDEEFA